MLGLLRSRRRFRTLYFADSLSMVGDWLTYVAVGLLALRGPQGVLGVALVQMAHSLPRAVSAPLAGWLSDRVDRRALLVGASLSRGAITLAMAVAAARDEVLWVEGLLFLRMAGASFVQAPSRAALPQLVERRELEPANRLVATSWAVLFTTGVALGGLVTGLLGPVVALTLDAGTFCLAGGLFGSLGRLAPAIRETSREERSLVRFPDRLAAALAKTPALFASGAAFVLLHDALGAAVGVAFGLGGLHAVRGAGNGIGPWLFRRVGDRRAVFADLIATLIGVLLLTVSHPAARAVACAVWGIGVGATWVGATVWLQRVTPDGILGRYAALDLGASGTASAAGGLTAAVLVVACEPQTAALVVVLGAVALFGATRLSRTVGVACLAGAALLSAPEPASAQSTLQEDLRSRAVTDTRFAQRVLWTWTTHAQVEAMRRDHQLLRSTADDGVRSPYQRALDTLQTVDGPHGQLARILTAHPALARRRYAWATPYGTVVPRGSRAYGTHLVRIELSPQAWTVRFAPDDEVPFSVTDSQGVLVDLADVIAEPTRIGAVYHVREDERGGAFREFVVHGGVVRWSLSTDAIRARLRDDRHLLRRLARRLGRDLRGRSMRDPWRAPSGSLAGDFAATMPFDTRRHRPAPHTFDALLAALRRRAPRGPPLVVEMTGPRRPGSGGEPSATARE
ncbi:MAG: MFS transporter [Sandaracinaceae bacterium]